MLLKESWKTWLYRHGFNLWPCFRGTGARVEHIAADFSEVRVRLPLSWRTWNRVGTIFGGSMYASTDPFFMLQLMEILGPSYVVWDKAAAIRFRRPGKEALYVEFHLPPERIAHVREAVAAHGEHDFTWKVELRNRAGVVHAEIEKTLYVARREIYEGKQALKARRKSGPS